MYKLIYNKKGALIEKKQQKNTICWPACISLKHCATKYCTIVQLYMFQKYIHVQWSHQMSNTIKLGGFKKKHQKQSSVILR